MRICVALPLARTVSRGIVFAVIGAGFAGCSTDVARMGDNPFRSFASAGSTPPTELTGSVHADASAAPVGRVEAQPLAAQPLPAPPPAYRSGTGAVVPPRTAATTEKLRAVPSAPHQQQAERPKVAAAAPKPQPAPAIAPAAAPKQDNVKVASIGPTVPAARMATPTIESAAENGGATVTGAVPSFRWPVRGRVIAGYGAKTNGQHNDGINIAVPEGTSVKASEDGVVAYAGNELKGYGNLVLIRHGNGFVTAYAHTSELMVKRGDAVKRGQIIAKAGQTGSVSSPQLHFEIRKGSTPVDPSQHLSGT